MKKGNWTTVIFLVVILAFVGFVFFGNKTKNDESNSEKEKVLVNPQVKIDVESHKNYGRDHIKAGDPDPTFVGITPTSGTHDITPADYGFYDKALKPRYYVHSLEHGDIVIHYNPKVDKQTLAKLKELTNITYKGSGVLAIPNTKIKTDLVVTAWTKTMPLKSYNQKKIDQFIFDYIYEGPEKLMPR